MRGHICRRSKNSWAVIVYLGRDAATGKERHKWFTHPTKQEAEAHLAQLLTQLHGGGTLPHTKATVAEFLQQWLQDYATGAVGPVTLATYRDMIRVHISPALGGIPLAKLSPQAVQGYLSRELEGLSPTTVRHHAMILHAALRHAVRWGLLARNPCDMVDPPRRVHAEMRVLDEEQVRLFLAEARRSSPHYALYLAAILTGMRQGELMGVRWRDVDLVLGVAAIQQTFYQMGRQQLFKEPKTPKARRNVALPKALIEELRRVRERQAEYRTLFGPEYQDHDLIFCQPNGKPLRANNIVRRDFRRVLKRASLPQIRFHDLRHCHATLLLRQGVHPKVVQERLGHSTPAFTLQVYSHVLPGLQAEAAEALGQHLMTGQHLVASETPADDS
jgi:integrase